MCSGILPSFDSFFSLIKTFNSSEKFPGAEIVKREMEYLYNDGELFYFMDNQTYE